MEHIFTDAGFNQEVLQSKVPVFVDFWAPWCGPCQMMLPIVDELKKEYEGKNIVIGKMNVDENSEIPAQYGIMSIPTFMVFKNGEIVDQVTGGVQKEKLIEIINKAI
ncbi:MAG: thioredoxin [bacterium]|nr:thioredoxin [bacterium]